MARAGGRAAEWREGFGRPGARPESGVRSLRFNADTMPGYPKRAGAFQDEAQTSRSGRNEKSNRRAAERIPADRNEVSKYPSGTPLRRPRAAPARFPGLRRCVMSIQKGFALALAATFSGLLAAGSLVPAHAQSAADAAGELALMLDSAANEFSGETLVDALEGAAEAGQPIAMWQLGLMYESGVGVERDEARAFHYFSAIANEHADAPPRSLDSDIVAQSFVKMGEYYRHGVPEAGVQADSRRAHALLLHAASYFGDAEAQFRVGELYLDPNELGINPRQGARWLTLAARKGHPGAQARLGQLLFSGEGVETQPVEGLMWMSLAQRGARGTADEGWIREIADSARAHASPREVEAAMTAAETLASQLVRY